MEVAADVVHLQVHDLERITAVRPREASVLFQGGRKLAEAVSKPGTYRIRFAYDAVEGSDYRKLVQASDKGVLLPPARLVTQAVTVTIVD